MPVPKRKTPRSVTRSRRSQWKSVAPAASVCPQCHAPKLPHIVCGNCGHYGRRKVLDVG